MKFATLVASTAFVAVVSTAQAQNVTTTDGDVVMIEKNQAAVAPSLAGGLGATAIPSLAIIGGLALTAVVVASSSGSGS